MWDSMSVGPVALVSLVVADSLHLLATPGSEHYLALAATLALVVGVFQLVFIVNLVYSYFRGRESGPNPWGAASLEWQTPETPPRHGNWTETLPTVHRWAYDYSVPGEEGDFIPQTEPQKPGAASAIGSTTTTKRDPIPASAA